MDKETGQILLPIFGEEWSTTLTLEMILHALEILVSVSDDVGSVGRAMTWKAMSSAELISKFGSKSQTVNVPDQNVIPYEEP